MPQPIRRLLARTSLTAALSVLALPAFAQSLSLLDARVVEGNAGDASLVFEARLSAPASGPVNFHFGTSDGTASDGGTVAGDDYRLVSMGGLSIPAGQTRMLVSVAVNGDVEVEANEFLNATIYNVTGASVARAAAKGLIVNDDNKMLVSAPLDPGAQTGSTGYANDFSALSGDGRYVAFVSTGRDLVAGRPANTVKNVYVRDTRTGVTTLASVAADGGDTDGDSTMPVLSYNGRYLAFQSAATNIAADDFNGGTDVFLRDLQTGTTTLVSVDASGTGPSGGWSSKPSMSADGRFVAFQSGGQLVAGVDTYGRTQAYVRDIQSGTTVLASRDPYGTQGDPQGGNAPHISSDGRFVSYDRNGSEPWRRDLQTGTSTIAIFTFGSGPVGSNSYNYGISTDGRYVVFLSWSSNLTNQCSGSGGQIFVSDLQTQTTRCASLMSDGIPSFSAFYPSISNDGRYVAFQASGAAVGEPWDGQRRIFVRDLQANSTALASFNSQGGANSGDDSEMASISGDGRVVSFVSYSTAMLPGDGNAQPDIFRVELPQDPSLPRISIADASVLEGHSGERQMVFTVSLSAPATSTVAFSPVVEGGSASAGVDYLPNAWTNYIPAGQSSTTFAIDVIGDTTPELVETFNVYLGSAYGAVVADGQASGIIGNDDYPPPPSISVGDVSISEGNSGTQLATFTATLSAPAAGTVTFDIATSDDSALAGSDYVAASQAGLSIPAGSTSATFSVVVNGDGVVEPQETFLVDIGNVSGANVADGHAIGSILNDDTYPSIAVSDTSVVEGNSGTRVASFNVSLSKPAASPVGFSIATSDGTGTAGSDYVARALSGQVIPVGASSASFEVTVNGDAAIEAHETFQATLSNVSGAVVHLNGQGTATIINDDVPPPSLSIADVSISEGNSGTKLATFTVQLSAPATAPVGYVIATANGTAVAPTDYTAKSLSGQSIPAGASSASFTVSINGDAAIEANETFLVNVTGVTGATVSDGQAVGTISNDDVLPSLSIADVSITEGNKSSVTATFTVSLSSASAGAVSFNIATANGTAVAPGDYTAKSSSAQSIPAGSLSKTFVVTVKSDKTVEPNENFLVNVTGVTGANVADAQAIGTIVNDDGAALSVARVTTGGLYDDIDDHRGDPVLAPREYALLLHDAAQQVCARAGGATIVAVDGVENLAVLADLADTANRSCARQPRYDAVLKAEGLGFLVERGTQLLGVANAGTDARANSLSVLAAGHARPLTVLLAQTPEGSARERVAQATALNRLLREQLAADPQARLVVLGVAGIEGLVDLTARSLPGAGNTVERIWVSPAVLGEFGRVQLDIPGAPTPKPSQQVLQLQP